MVNCSVAWQRPGLNISLSGMGKRACARVGRTYLNNAHQVNAHAYTEPLVAQRKQFLPLSVKTNEMPSERLPERGLQRLGNPTLNREPRFFRLVPRWLNSGQ